MKRTLARIIVAYEKQSVHCDWMRKSIIALLAVIASIMVITLTPVGSLFVYGWLVPKIDPLIPKPEGVPSHANASYHWKGFGLVWKWDYTVSAGCAHWLAAESYGGPYRSVEFFEGDRGCKDGLRTMSRVSSWDNNIYDDENEPTSEECHFTLSKDTISKYRTQVVELNKMNNGTLETQMLEAMLAELKAINGQNMLTRNVYGCVATQF